MMIETDTFTLRTIEPRDDAAIAAIIRSVMPEFGAGGAGFAIHDAEVAAMSAAYAGPNAAYFVIESNHVVRGGGGFAPLENATPDICELRKMYFLPELRGRGAGHALIRHCLDTARQAGFARCYIETLTGMDAAQHLYLRNGFTRLDAAMGSTGHHGCNRFYLRDL